jgi:hypothetical protein
MTQDEIIKLAKKAGIHVYPEFEAAFERFYDLAIKPWAKQLKAERKRFEEYRDMTVGVMRDVRMDERKECAKVCEAIAGDRHLSEAQKCANAIRARGNNDKSI